MNSIIELPQLVIEIHRYTKPTDGWVFVHMNPVSDWVRGTELPFGDFGLDPDDHLQSNLPWYDRHVEGWGEAHWADPHRDQIIKEGFTKLSWMEVESIPLRNHIAYNQAPHGWGDDLVANDPELVDMITVWMKGDLP